MTAHLEAPGSWIPGENFKLRIQTWGKNLETGGKLADSSRAEFAHGRAEKFCRRYTRPMSASFYFSEYCRDTAKLLCLAWAHKLEHFYSIAQDDRRFMYSQEQIDSYVEPDWVVRDLIAAAPKPAAWDRLAKIRRIKPRNPRRDEHR